MLEYNKNNKKNVIINNKDIVNMYFKNGMFLLFIIGLAQGDMHITEFFCPQS